MNIPWIGALLLAACLCASCQKRDVADERLPPAVGDGVPAAEVPSVDALMAESTEEKSPRASNVAGTGTLYPRIEAELGPKLTGVLASVNVTEGDPVRKGQVMFRLERFPGRQERRDPARRSQHEPASRHPGIRPGQGAQRTRLAAPGNLRADSGSPPRRRP